MIPSPLGPRPGWAGFAFWSALAFVPALAAALHGAWRAAEAAVGEIALALAGGGLDGAAGPFAALSPSAAGTGLAGSFEALGWACFGWLAACRCRDIGDPPGLGALAALPTAFALAPGALPGAGTPVSLGILAWSLRLGLARPRLRRRAHRGPDGRRR